MTDEERRILEQEIRNLTCDLESSLSGGVGDYRIVRFVEALVLSDKFWEMFGPESGVALPYTREQVEAFCSERQAKRDRIREIQRLLADGEVSE